MKTKSLKTKRLMIFSLAALGLNILSNNLFAQPVVSYTVSGTSGDYTLDFTLNNATPGTSGFDDYFFGVLVDGAVSGSPSGYYSSYYSNLHNTEVPGAAVNWPFNNTWIDPTYTVLPTGSTLSGFDVTDYALTAPTSVQYFVFGEDNGQIYTGRDNDNTGNPSNPLFVGYALAAVPEPASLPIITGACMLLLSCWSRVRS